MITHHTQLLNALIEKYGLKSYLEIGIQNPANNFDKINCERKVGVDPDVMNRSDIYDISSDRFFLDHFNTHIFNPTPETFDLIFIDGLHHADQVKRDFENSLRCLSDNGFIVIHDVLPENEAGTIVPRETKVWWGTVFSFAMNIHRLYYGLSFITLNIDNGCMVVRKTGTVGDFKFQPYNFSWQEYLQDGKRLMNVTDEVTI